MAAQACTCVGRSGAGGGVGCVLARQELDCVASTAMARRKARPAPHAAFRGLPCPCDQYTDLSVKPSHQLHALFTVTPPKLVRRHSLGQQPRRPPCHSEGHDEFGVHLVCCAHRRRRKRLHLHTARGVGAVLGKSVPRTGGGTCLSEGRQEVQG